MGRGWRGATDHGPGGCLRLSRRVVAAVVVVLLSSTACGGEPQPGEAGVEGVQGGVLLLSGTIDLVAETAELGAARRLPSRRKVAAVDAGPFRLVLEDQAGQEAAKVDFEPAEPSPSSDGAVVAHFTLRIADALPPLTRATVSYRGQILGTREAGPAVPTVTVTSPASGQVVPYRHAVFAWEGRDGDGDDLVYHVLVSLDDGKTWTSLVSGTDRTEITVEPGSPLLRPTPHARLIVAVSDGLNSTWVESESFPIR